MSFQLAKEVFVSTLYIQKIASCLSIGNERTRTIRHCFILAVYPFQPNVFVVGIEPDIGLGQALNTYSPGLPWDNHGTFHDGSSNTRQL